MSVHAAPALQPVAPQSAAAPWFAAPSRQVLRRACACGGTPGPDGECAACRTERLARKRDGTGEVEAGVPPIVHDVLRSSGRPLDPATRAFMEPRFGHDFGRVRVHADARAAASARAVHALAFTVGRDIVFAPGQYAPSSTEGRRLLAHELAHVVQQRGTTGGVLPHLAVGAGSDPAETEADRVATRVMSSPAAGGAGTAATLTPSPPVLRRQTRPPQRPVEDDARLVTLPVETDAAGQVRRQVHVFRNLVPCPCRRVDETRTGIFYNPDLDNVAIAYRYCRGGTTVDVYGQLQSNATAFLQGQAPPVGTGRVGIDVNVVGRRDSAGRLIVEALGTNESGAGIGGRAQLVFERGQWRIFLEPQYIRRLEALPGATTQNELQVSLGARFGNVSVRFDLTNLLDPTARTGRGTIDLPLGPISIQPFVEAGEGRGTTFGVGVGGTLDIPSPRREEVCRQCLCPAPARKYRCLEDVPPRDVPTQETVEVTRQPEFRYYFRLNRTAPSTDPSLSARSESNLAAVASQVTAGGRVTLIFGYASPEATERHNADLSLARATRLRDLVRSRLATGAELPEPAAGGELLGRRPRATPSSRLGDVITRSGFRSAEDLSFLLLGEEIPNPELARQFLSLFAALPEPADRLALFGLAADDPIRDEVLAAVDRFVRSGGRGPRPWERVFQYLRFGAVRVTRTETIEQTGSRRDPGSLDPMSDADCRPYARQAEETGRFGPIDPTALRPTSTSSESNDDCLIAPQPADREKGCLYELPANFRQRATAPAVAPRSLP